MTARYRKMHQEDAPHFTSAEVNTSARNPIFQGLTVRQGRDLMDTAVKPKFH